MPEQELTRSEDISKWTKAGLRYAGVLLSLLVRPPTMFKRAVLVVTGGTVLAAWFSLHEYFPGGGFMYNALRDEIWLYNTCDDIEGVSCWTTVDFRTVVIWAIVVAAWGLIVKNRVSAERL